MIKILNSLTILLAALTLSSCSVYNKLLKEGDTETKYAEGKRYYEQKKYKKTIGLYNNIFDDIVGTPREDTLLFYLGKAYYNDRDFATAQETFDSYRSRFTRSSFVEEAEFLYAMCHYRSVLPQEKDQTSTRQAIIAFNEYLNRYPNSEQTPFIHEMIEDLTEQIYFKTYMNSALYHKLGHFNAAITSMRAVIKDQPEIPFRQEMMYLIVRSWFDYAENSIFSRQLERYMKMIDAYYNYKSEYPESKLFDKSLEEMFAKASDFTDKYGTQAQTASTIESAIAEHKKNIATAKEELFNVNSKEDKNELRATITHERESIKKLKGNTKQQKKELKTEERIKKQLEKDEASATAAENQF